MSHATNLRARENALQAASLSSKRRRSSPSIAATDGAASPNGRSSSNYVASSTSTFANGNSITKKAAFAAQPTRDAKASHHRHVQAASEVPSTRIQDGSQLTNGVSGHVANDIEMEDVSSDDEEDSEDESDDGDSENDLSDSTSAADSGSARRLKEPRSQASKDKAAGTSREQSSKESAGVDPDPDDNNDDDDDDEEEEVDEDVNDQGVTADSSLMDMTNGVESVADDADDGEPSFGDLLRQRAPEAVDVEAAMAVEADQALVNNDRFSTTARRNMELSIPTAASLGTVLTQALRTNDVDLLETCLQMQNLDSIKATIERLHSPLSTRLLQRLAERLHRRPGRAGSLMVWVQWTVVAHGGYLASQPAAMKEIRILYQVVKQRANALQPLLALKGKLDMLEAQLQLRKSMQAQNSRNTDAEDEDDVVYIEGEEQSTSDDDDHVNADDAAAARRSRTKGGRIEAAVSGDTEEDIDIATLGDFNRVDDDEDNLDDDVEDDEDEDDEEDDELEDDDDDDSQGEDDLLDDEAEESENDSQDDEDAALDMVGEVEYDSGDDDEHDSEQDSEAGGEGSSAQRPPKRSKTSRI